MLLPTFALVVTGTQFVTVGVGPGSQFGAISGDVELVRINQLEFYGTGHEAGKKDSLQALFPLGQSRKIAKAIQHSRQGGGLLPTSPYPVSQPFDNTLMRLKIIFVLLFRRLILRFTVVMGPLSGGSALLSPL
jgi:hypothetical protein